MMRFSIVLNFPLGSPTSLWLRLILFWCDIGQHQCLNYYITLWCTHKPCDNLGANYTSRIKKWLRYQKGLSPFVSNGPPHLKHVVVIEWHIHIESLIFFMDRHINKVLFYALHVKFEQVLGFLPSPRKKSRILFTKKKIKDSQTMYKQIFWLKIFYHKHLRY